MYLTNTLLILPAVLLAGWLLLLSTRQQVRGVQVITIALLLELSSVAPPLLERNTFFGRASPWQAAVYSFALAACCGAYLFVRGRPMVRRIEQVPTRTNPRIARSTIQLAILFSVLVAAMLFQFSGLPPVGAAVRNILSPTNFGGDVSQIRLGRQTLTKSHYFGGAYRFQGLLEAVRSVGWPLAAVLAVRLWMLQSSTRLFAGSVLVTGLLVNLASGVRADVIWLVAAIGFGALSTRRLSIARGAAIGLIGVLCFVAISPLAKGVAQGGGLANRLGSVAERITSGNGTVNIFVLEKFRSAELQPEGGALLAERMKAILPGTSESEPFAYRLSQLRAGTSSANTSYLTPTHLGNLWADGGPVLVVIGYTVTGAILAVAEALRRRLLRRGDLLNEATSVALAIVAARMVVGGVPGIIASLLLLSLMRWGLRVATAGSQHRQLAADDRGTSDVAVTHA